MLTPFEKKVMKSVYSVCKQKGSCLLSPQDLKSLISVQDSTLDGISDTVRKLEFDGYFDIVYSDRHGETVFCITLKEKGYGFERENQVARRNLIFRLCLTVIFAVISFIVGLILKKIF